MRDYVLYVELDKILFLIYNTHCREEGMGVREEDKDRGGTSEGQRLKTDKVRSAFFNLF